MSLFPYFRSPFTDLTGCLLNHQHFGKCAELEMKHIECLEAYGQIRGEQKCRDYADDLYECVYKTKQFERVAAMKKERQRQYLAGEVPKDQRYAPSPVPDTY